MIFIIQRFRTDDGNRLLCIVRGDPEKFDASTIECEIIDQTHDNFVYGDGDELVSDLLNITIDGVPLGVRK